MGQHSGIGVLDKAVQVLEATTAAPSGLADLCAATGLPRATAHRLAVGLEVHGLLTRDSNGRWCPGPYLAVLAAGAPDPLVTASADVLPRLRDRTGESVQVYRPDGLSRICIAVAEPVAGLRDTVPLGARLPMNAGSGAKVLVAWADPSTQRALLARRHVHRAHTRRGPPARLGPVGGGTGGRGGLGLRAGARPARIGDRRGVGVRAGGADRPAPGRAVGRRPGGGR